MFSTGSRMTAAAAAFSPGRGAGISGAFWMFTSSITSRREQGFISIPSGNHDIGRLAMGRTMADLEVAFAFLMTQPGVPYIYMGDEIGMRQVEGLASKEGGFGRTGARTPMQWDAGKNAGFSKAAAKTLNGAQ